MNERRARAGRRCMMEANSVRWRARRFRSCDRARRQVDVSVNPDAAPDYFGLPIFVEDGPQNLVEVFAVAQERFSEDTLLNGADLPQCAVAAAVLDRRTRLEAMNSDCLECKGDHQIRSFFKYARSPER